MLIVNVRSPRFNKTLKIFEAGTEITLLERLNLLFLYIFTYMYINLYMANYIYVFIYIYNRFNLPKSVSVCVYIYIFTNWMYKGIPRTLFTKTGREASPFFHQQRYVLLFALMVIQDNKYNELYHSLFT